jgi:hypothetical protein
VPWECSNFSDKIKRSLNKAMEISPNHQRATRVGLYMLEKSLERIEEVLTPEDGGRISYRVNDYLDDKVRSTVLQDIEKTRSIIRHLKDELNLQTQEESMARKVRSEASHLWEMLSDMRSTGLDRYGKTRKELADFWNPKVEELTEIMLRIGYLMEARSNKPGR